MATVPFSMDAFSMESPMFTPTESNPLPSERLRVGECTVELPLREITAPGARRPRRVTPKAMGVLRVLVAHAGKVVSRDMLLAEVWPGTLPTDDVITQAVTQLRKAFGEKRSDAQYIETIAKTGYRLLAPVEWLLAEEDKATVAAQTDIGGGAEADDAAPGAVLPAPKAAPVPPPAQTTRRWWYERLLVGVVAFMAAIMVVLLLLLRQPEQAGATVGAAMEPSSPERPYHLLTSAPGFELWPTLSPDASMIAYAASRPGLRGLAIRVQTTNASQPRQLSQPEDGIYDRVPAWSPDGREIAWLRYGPGETCQVLVADAGGGGAERNVSACDFDDMSSFDWTPDGRALVFGSMRTADGGTSGLRLLDLQSGRWRDLSYPSAGSALDQVPHYSPDGRWIGFVRNPQLGDLWRIPADGGEPEQLTDIGGEFRGWDWLPDGSGIVFGRRIDSEVRLYHLDLATRRIRDLGLDDAQLPAVAERAGVMAFVRRRPQFGLFRINRSVDSGPVRREHLFASSGRDTMPSLAPDGRQLVFSSNRSGHFHLWWANLEAPHNLRQIEGVHPDTHSRPEWSADSRRMLVVGHDDDDRKGVFEVVPESGQITLLPMPGPEFRTLQAMYTPDPGRVLMTVRDPDGELCLVLLDRTRTPWKVLAKIEDVSHARVDPAHQRVLFTRLSADGLWQANLSLAETSIRVVDSRRPARWRYQTWTVAEDGSIDYLEPRQGCLSSLRVLGADDDGVGEEDKSSVRCLSPDRLSATTSFSSSSRLDAVIAAQTVDDGTDIGLMATPPSVSE